MSRFMPKSICLVAAWSMLLICSACGQTEQATALDPKDPVCIKIWNYYNGNQTLAFDGMVEEFNATVGRDLGIVVEASSQGSIDGVVTELISAVTGEAGAQSAPDLVAVYMDTAYTLDQMDLAADLDQYFSAEELAEYVPAFLRAGRLSDDGPLINFPISKSTEVFVYNATDWAAFEDATGVSPQQTETMEGLVSAAEAYYTWTDDLTPDIAEDGRALFGRDSMGNYMLLGAYQLGHEIFTVRDGNVVVDLDYHTMRTLWDNYYIPFINGYFGAYGNYRSDDAKIGRILAMVGSSAGVGYFPTQVTRTDDSTYPIEAEVTAPPVFANAVNQGVVQQGAGYCLIKSTEQKQYAASIFLKWITQADQNANFSSLSSYLPVKTAALEASFLQTELASAAQSANVANSLLVSAKLVQNTPLFSPAPFSGSVAARNAVEDAIELVSIADRAEVESRLAAGMSRDAAVAEFSTQAYFDTWYAGLQAAVTAAIAGQ